MLAAIPLMIIPLIFYNVLIFGPFDGSGVAVLSMEVFSLSMVSGAVWTMHLGDVVIVTALGLLFFEVLKATRTGSWSLIDHLLSTLVFVAFWWNSCWSRRPPRMSSSSSASWRSST